MQTLYDNLVILNADIAEWPIFICVLGSFRLLIQGQAVSIAGRNTKAAPLLFSLALQPNHSLPRDVLLQTLWQVPDWRKPKRPRLLPLPKQELPNQRHQTGAA